MTVPDRGAPRRRAVLQGLVPVHRSAVPTEVLAGVTLAALAIPEVMGYTDIAGMPVITGLYTILVPVVAFALLGSSRHLVVGADSATAAVLAAGLTGVAATGSPRYVALAGLVALLTAALLVIARIVGLGFLADFLSRTVLIGFLTGVGIQVACGQVGGLFGIPEASGVTVGGHEYSNTVTKLVATLGNLDGTSLSTLAVSVGVLVVILGTKHLTTKVPGALVAVVGAILVSWGFDLAAHGIAVVGPVPGGLPSVGLPDVGPGDVRAVFATTLSIVILVLAQSAATSRAYAGRYDDDFDEGVDLVGLASANLAAGLTGTFVVNGSPTKTEMVDSAGGRSQLAQLTAALVVLVVLVFLTGPIQYLPEAVLSSVVFLIGIQLVDLAGMRRVWRLRRDEFVVAAATAATVVVLGVEQGIVLAMAASLADHLRRSYRPDAKVLQPNRTGAGWHSVPLAPGVRSLPGLVVLRWAGSLYYANADHLVQLVAGIVVEPDPVRCVCIDASAIPDIDVTGSDALRQVHDRLTAHHVRLMVANPMAEVRAELDRYGLSELFGPGSVFDTVADAAVAFEAGRPSRPPGWGEDGDGGDGPGPAPG